MAIFCQLNLEFYWKIWKWLKVRFWSVAKAALLGFDAEPKIRILEVIYNMYLLPIAIQLWKIAISNSKKVLPE